MFKSNFIKITKDSKEMKFILNNMVWHTFNEEDLALEIRQYLQSQMGSDIHEGGGYSYSSLRYRDVHPLLA